MNLLKKLNYKAIFAIYCLLCCGYSALAENSKITVSAEIPSVRYTIGDTIELTLKAAIPQNVRVIFPGDNLDIAPFVILDRRISPPLRQAEGIVESLILKISVYEVGEFDIPGIEIHWELEDGTRDSAWTEPLFVRIDSVLTQDDTSFRNTKPVVDVQPRKRYIFGVITSTIFALAALIAAIRFLRHARKRSNKKLDETPEIIRPADEVALEELAQLREGHHLGRGDIKQYFILLTEILKTYIGRRFIFNAPERTTGEIRRAMRTLSIEQSVQSEILHVLEVADMVKFARFLPSDDVCRQALNDSEKIVLRTRDRFGKADDQAGKDKRAL